MKPTVQSLLFCKFASLTPEEFEAPISGRRPQTGVPFETTLGLWGNSLIRKAERSGYNLSDATVSDLIDYSDDRIN